MSPLASARRLALETVLRDRLTAAEFDHALRLFDRNYAEQPDYSASKFIKELGELCEIRDRKASLLVEIHQAMAQVNKGLPAVASTRSGALTRTAAVRGQVSAELTRAAVFNRLVIEIVQRIEERNLEWLEELRRLLMIRLRTLELQTMTADACDRWTRNLRTASFTDESRVEELSEVLHVVYVWVCEKIGPVATDHLFGSALRDTEQIPAAAVHSPRQFM